MADLVTTASRRQTAATNALVCAALAAIVYLLLILTTFKYGRDQGIYAVVSDTILGGGAPYRDAWDFKPPLVFFVYAAARGLLGTGMESIRIAEAMGLASLVVAFAILSRRLVGAGFERGPAYRATLDRQRRRRLVDLTFTWRCEIK